MYRRDLGFGADKGTSMPIAFGIFHRTSECPVIRSFQKALGTITSTHLRQLEKLPTPRQYHKHSSVIWEHSACPKFILRIWYQIVFLNSVEAPIHLPFYPSSHLLIHSLFYPSIHFCFLKILFILDRGQGREKERERNINLWLPLMHPLLGTWPATQASNQWLFGSQVQRSIHWATPARAGPLL